MPTSDLPQLTVPGADPGLVSDAHVLFRELSELLRVVQFRDRDRACCYDISVSQCYALEAVANTGPLTVNDLAARLYLDKSTASRVADGLEQKGCVVRERDPGDGRSVRLRATEEGHALCRQIEDDLAREYADMLAELEPEVRSAIIRLVTRLASSFASRVDASGGSCCVVR